LVSSYGYNDPLNQLISQSQQSIGAISSNPGLSDLRRSDLLSLARNGFNSQRKRITNDMLDQYAVNNPLGKLQGSFGNHVEDLEKIFSSGAIKDDSEVGKSLLLNLKQSYIKSSREVNVPHGTEKFTSDAFTVGSAEDRELKNRMLGVFSTPKDPKEDEIKAMTLEMFKKFLEEQKITNQKLEVGRLGL
jgi:hypothetical protein